MTTTDTTRRLTELPAPVQDQLLRLAYLADNLTPQQRTDALGMTASLGLGIALRVDPRTSDDMLPAGEMFTTLGRIVQATADAAAEQKGA